MSSIRAVLFDLDDTLWPIVPVIQRAEKLLYAWLKLHAAPVTERVTIESMRERRQQLMASDPVYQRDLRILRRTVLLEAFADAGLDTRLVDEAMEVFSKARNEVTPFADVLPALENLRSRVMLGSVSNGVADLDAIGIAHYFQASVAAHRIGCAKPDAAIFHAACDALGVAPAETLYVGDDPLLDVEGAQKAGLRAAWINRVEIGQDRVLPSHVTPDAVFGNLHQLEQWLKDNDPLTR
ncbi:HAD family hydrolase [Noviherbaspirillum denitrificans]|uniref:Hydrolase n=1 Tax=Noviherbaspirillum denitrificans TaxID=1968433 RepID=A0A254TK67_9BURK|nr:HAD family hydrolase [Noviherbaspirillum denitrificans]OWW20098.1 hydrolase [Noviherbaspirillum denitrificans]